MYSSGRRSLFRFSVFYLSIAIAELGSPFVSESVPWLHYVAKPMIMISLLGFYLSQSRFRQELSDYLMLGALLFSLLGDVLLMFEGELFFMLGLGAFLLAHLCYIGLFSLSHHSFQERSVLRRKPWLLLLFVAYGAGLISLIWPGLGELYLPVVIYAVVICGMSLAALNRWKRVPEDSFAAVFLGSLLFMLSDSMIAVERFAADILPIPLAHTWVMLTYMAAQFLIITGMLIQIRRPRPQVAGMN
jgi:uncharacterized membrane protein YhhN